MRYVQISRQADRDLTAILATSLARWGLPGRDRYHHLLAGALERLALDPDDLLSKDRGDLTSGLRSFHLRHMGKTHGVAAPVHVIYYLASPTVLRVARVLHERMAPAAHFPTARARR